jgi:type IV pilus assembly protein PilO
MKGMINLVFFAIIAYVAWDYYSFTTDPTSEFGARKVKLEQTVADVAAKEKKIAEAKTFYQNLERKRDELRRLSTELATMKSTLTENNDIPAFMKLVLSEAKHVGLTVKSLSPLASSTKQYYIEQPFDLEYQGVYVQLIAFLDRLAQAERIVRIDDFSVKPRGGTSKGSKFIDLEGTIKVRSYVYLGTQEDAVATSGGSDAVPKPSGTSANPNGSGAK